MTNEAEKIMTTMGLGRLFETVSNEIEQIDEAKDIIKRYASRHETELKLKEDVNSILESLNDEQIQEVSRALLARYTKKAVVNKENQKSRYLHTPDGSEDEADSQRRYVSRDRGINKAIDRLAKD